MIRILLVEDERLTLQMLDCAIDWASAGYEICGTAMSGVEGLEKYRSLRPDVVLTDIQMPGMTGLQLIEAIRDVDEGRARFLILTAHGEFEFARKALQMQADAYLLKPIDEEELLQALNLVKERIAPQAQSEPQPDSAINMRLIREANEYAAAHFDDPNMSLESVCDALGISRSYFSSLYHSACGIKFWDHITNLRMSKARQLLKDTRMRIADVAESCGYLSEFHFSRTFKKVEGITCKAYRDR